MNWAYISGHRSNRAEEFHGALFDIVITACDYDKAKKNDVPSLRNDHPTYPRCTYSEDHHP